MGMIGKRTYAAVEWFNAEMLEMFWLVCLRQHLQFLGIELLDGKHCHL